MYQDALVDVVLTEDADYLVTGVPAIFKLGRNRELSGSAGSAPFAHAMVLVNTNEWKPTRLNRKGESKPSLDMRHLDSLEKVLFYVAFAGCDYSTIRHYGPKRTLEVISSIFAREGVDSFFQGLSEFQREKNDDSGMDLTPTLTYAAFLFGPVYDMKKRCLVVPDYREQCLSRHHSNVGDIGPDKDHCSSYEPMLKTFTDVVTATKALALSMRKQPPECLLSESAWTAFLPQTVSTDFNLVDGDDALQLDLVRNYCETGVMNSTHEHAKLDTLTRLLIEALDSLHGIVSLQPGDAGIFFDGADSTSDSFSPRARQQQPILLEDSLAEQQSAIKSLFPDVLALSDSSLRTRLPVIPPPSELLRHSCSLPGALADERCTMESHFVAGAQRAAEIVQLMQDSQEMDRHEVSIGLGTHDVLICGRVRSRMRTEAVGRIKMHRVWVRLRLKAYHAGESQPQASRIVQSWCGCVVGRSFCQHKVALLHFIHLVKSHMCIQGFRATKTNVPQDWHSGALSCGKGTSFMDHENVERGVKTPARDNTFRKHTLKNVLKDATGLRPQLSLSNLVAATHEFHKVHSQIQALDADNTIQRGQLERQRGEHLSKIEEMVSPELSSRKKKRRHIFSYSNHDEAFDGDTEKNPCTRVAKRLCAWSEAVEVHFRLPDSATDGLESESAQERHTFQARVFPSGIL